MAETESILLHEHVETAAPLFSTAVGVLLALQALVAEISSGQLYHDKTRCVNEPAPPPAVVSPKRAAKKLLFFRHCKGLSTIFTWFEIACCVSPPKTCKTVR